MIWYLFKILALLIFSFVVLVSYYFVFPWHVEDFNWYFSYFIVIWIIYWIYKYFQLNKSSEVAIFTPLKIVWIFLINLLILSIYFFNLGWYNLWNWIELFFKILFFSSLPIVILSITTSLWDKITSKIPNIDLFWDTWKILLSITLGLFSFLFLLTIFASIGLYNLLVVIIILLLMIIISYKNFIELFKKIIKQEYTFNIKEWSYMKFLSLEVFFFIWFIVLWTALISIYRPYPIWWDDLGVYMNVPHLMSESWSLSGFWWMISWQIFTWIWYMFKVPTFAFFINISGLFLSFFALNKIFSEFLNDKINKSFFHLPSMLSTLFIALPMVVFQTSKDMKVDEWLFFISIVVLYFIYKYYLLIKEWTKVNIIYIFIIWLLVWFAFTIKFTSLLLIVWLLSLISYTRLWLLWLFWYLWIFFWIFTIWNLWIMMNVIINPIWIEWFETFFWIFSVLFWFILILIWLYNNKLVAKKYLLEVFILILWIFVSILPWISKNLIESYSNITISSLLNWKSDHFNPDFTSFERKTISDKTEDLINSKLPTNDPDLMRYFGYEKGILNFINMPWNLTMQKNQGNEFTDIGFLFFALLPLIFIFLPYKNKNFAYFFVLLSIFQLLLFIRPWYNVVNKIDYNWTSSWSLYWVFTENNYLFNDKFWKENIYDIEFNSYVNDSIIETWLVEEEIKIKTDNYINTLIKDEAFIEFQKLNKHKQTQDSFNKIYSELSKSYSNNYKDYFDNIYNEEFYKLKDLLYNNFYLELSNKVKGEDNTDWISFLSVPLNENDYEYISHLANIYSKTSIFIPEDIVSLNELLIVNNSSENEIKEINNLWKNQRTLNGSLIDSFAKINLPLGYAYIFILFFIPVLFLLFTLKSDDKIIKLFKLNLVFASVYTFLWLISSFWIVWYWITMYFSFLLMIWISASYIWKYNDDENENTYLFKLIGSFTFICIFIIYFWNSVIPHTFTNLKNASFEPYKTWNMTHSEAIFRYHPDYKVTLFTLNIDSSKKEEFLNETINEEILEKNPWLEKKEIVEVFEILWKYKSDDWLLKIYAKQSLEKIYKWILNPKEEYKNKEIVYRVWTFLRYYISENNKRLLEDSLLFTYNDYIHWDNNSITTSRFRKLWVNYLLIDLNAATIDKSDDHLLTNRYEKILKTFTSNNLELIETDSICLQLWLDKYKESKDIDEYMILAWTNYESYDIEWKQISRSRKLASCIKYIDFLLENDQITENKYKYLLPFKNHFANNEKSIEAINALIKRPYKALFRVK